MKFTVSSTVLASKLSILAKVIQTKNTLAILDCFVFDVQDGLLIVSASGGTEEMNFRLPLTETDGNGAFCVPNRTILSAVKALPELPLTFEVEPEAGEMKVRYAGGVFNMMVQQAQLFPHLSYDEPSSTEFQITAAALCENLGRTIFAAATDELRLVMNGVCFDLKEDRINIVASNGTIMVRNMVFGAHGEQGRTFILPRKPSQLIAAALSPDDVSNVTVQFGQTSVQFFFPDGWMICRQQEGRYPEYNNAIPADNPYIVTVDRLSLLAAVRRAATFASSSTRLVRVRLDCNTLELSANDVDFGTSLQENVMCQYGGAQMIIGFDAQSLSDVLSNLNCGEVTLELADPSRAGIVKPAEQPEGTDVLMLLMPMLVTD